MGVPYFLDVLVHRDSPDLHEDSRGAPGRARVTAVGHDAKVLHGASKDVKMLGRSLPGWWIGHVWTIFYVSIYWDIPNSNPN